MNTIYDSSNKIVILEASLFDRKVAREYLMQSQVEFKESKGFFSSKFFVKPNNVGTEILMEQCTWYKPELNEHSLRQNP